MKNRLLSFCLLLASSATWAAASPTPEFTAIYQIKTENQAVVAGAWARFAQSECRKNLPAAFRIMRESFNGDEDISHSVIWNFPDAQAMQTTFNKIRACREWADAQQVIDRAREPKSQLLLKTLAAGGDYTKDQAYFVWQLRISDEAAYLAEYRKLMADQEESGQVTGAWGLWRVLGGATDEVTHIAYAGAASLPALLSASEPSAAFTKFQSKVSKLRKIHRMNINRVLADL